MELYCPAYGEYDALVYAIKTITHMINSKEFKELLTITIIMSVVFSLAANAANFIYTFKVELKWAKNLLLGVLLAAFAVTYKVDLIIEDKSQSSSSYGYFEPVKNVPAGAGMLIWFYTYSVDAITKLINNSGAPIIAYEDIGTDVTYKLITDMEGLPDTVQKAAPNLYSNLLSYANNCVVPGVAMEQIKMSSLTTPKLTKIWDNMLVKGSVFNTEYKTDNGKSLVINCEQAHTEIKTDFDLKYLDIMEHYCSSQKLQSGVCTNKFNKITEGFFGYSGREYIINYLAASTTKTVVTRYTEQADKQVNITNTIASVQAEKWLPKLRASTFVIIVIFAPIIALLIFFAPGETVKWYGGMYVWLILWGAVDQLMLVIYQKELYDLFKVMRASGFGITQILDAKSVMLESLGMYGKMRWASMGMSLAMCVGILKIGNTAMSSLADSIGSVVQQTAGQAADRLSGFGGTDSAKDSMLREEARARAIKATPDRAIANAATVSYMSEVGYANTLADNFGGAAPAGAIKGAADAYSSMSNIGSMDNFSAQAADHNMSTREFGNYLANNRVVTEGNLNALEQTFGAKFNIGQQLSYDYAGDGQFKNLVATESNFAREGISGTRVTRFDEKGNVSSINFDGLMGGQEVHVFMDGKDNYINYRGVSGNESVENISYRTVHLGTNANLGNVATESALRGETPDYLSHTMFKGNDTYLSKSLINAQADALGQYHNQARNMGGSVDLSAAVKFFGAGGGFSANVTDAEYVNMIRSSMHDKYESLYNDKNLSLKEKAMEWDNYTSGFMSVYKGVSESDKATIVANIVKDNASSATNSLLLSKTQDKEWRKYWEDLDNPYRDILK